MFTITDAIIIAAEGFRNRKDDGGVDYILHPLYIAHKIKMRGCSIETVMTAILHDSLEDTDLTIDYLKERGCPESVLIALELLTHVRDQKWVNERKQYYINQGDNTKLANRKAKDEEYFIYIKRLSKNDICREVKIQDLRHNGDIRRAPDDVYTNEYTWNRWAKYAHALKMLTGGKVGYV